MFAATSIFSRRYMCPYGLLKRQTCFSALNHLLFCIGNNASSKKWDSLHSQVHQEGANVQTTQTAFLFMHTFPFFSYFMSLPLSLVNTHTNSECHQTHHTHTHTLTHFKADNSSFPAPRPYFTVRSQLSTHMLLDERTRIPANRWICMETALWEGNLCSQISGPGAQPVNIKISPLGPNPLGTLPKITYNWNTVDAKIILQNETLVSER